MRGMTNADSFDGQHHFKALAFQLGERQNEISLPSRSVSEEAPAELGIGSAGASTFRRRSTYIAIQLDSKHRIRYASSMH